MDAFIQDLKHSFRLLRKNPGFAAAALGGAHAWHWRQHRHLFGRQRGAAPARRASRARSARVLHERHAGRAGARGVAGQVPALEGAVRCGDGRVGIQHGRHELHRRVVSRTAQIRAARRRTSSRSSAPPSRRGGVPPGGRPARRREDGGHQPHFWQTRFNTAPDIIGKTLSLGGEPVRVIGVLGKDVTLPRFRRTGSGCVGGVPDRSQLRRSGPLLQCARPAEARRHADDRRRTG